MMIKANAQEAVQAGIAGGAGLDFSTPAPHFVADLECIGPDGVPKWKTRWKNVVTDQGRGEALNKLFGCTGAYTASWFLGLHSLAATNQTHRLSNITASECGSYGANRPQITFASTYTTGSATASCSYGFTAGTQTISGAFVGNVQQTASTAGVLYSEGNFGASRQAQNADTLNVTLTLSF
jgi:hypothetical protein